MSKLSILSRQTWLRSLFVSTLAFFMVTGVVFGATTISSNIDTGGTLTVTGTSTLNGTADLNGQADIGDGGDTITINGSDVSITDAGGQWGVTGAGSAEFADLDVGGGILNHVDGTNDLSVADSIEVDSNVYVEGSFFAYGASYIGNNIADTVTFNSTPTFNYDVTIGNDASDSLQVNSTATFDSAVIFTGNTYHQGNVYTYGPTSIGDSAVEAHTVTGIMTFNQNILVNGDATLGNGGGTITIGDGGATDSVVITDANWSITDPGAATFTGLDVDGNVNLGSGTGDTIDVHDNFSVSGITVLDGDTSLGDISGSGMILELSIATNDFFVGSGNGTITLGEGGGDSIYIGNGSGDGVTLGGGSGDQIVIGGTGGDSIKIGANGGTGDSIDIGTDGGQVTIETGNGSLTIGSGQPITDVYYATADLDFGSIATSDCAELTMTVTGAGVGDTIFLGPPSTIENDLTWSGYASAVDTVTVRVCNMNTSSAIDPASATWAANTFLME